MKKSVCAGAFALAAAAAHAAPLASTPSLSAYDAELSARAATRVALAKDVSVRSRAARTVDGASRYGYPAVFDPALGVPSFVWGEGEAPRAAGALQPRPLAIARARDYLGQRAAQLGLTRQSIADAQVREVHDTGRGAVIVRLAQYVDATPVYGRQLNVMLDRDGRLVAISGYFAPQADARSAAAGSFSLDAPQALAVAVADLGGRLPLPRSLRRDGEYEWFAAPARLTGALQLQRDLRAKRVYFPLNGRLVAAWYTETFAQRGSEALAYAHVISAEDGRVLKRHDLTAFEAYSYRVFADASGDHQPLDSPLGNGYVPFPGKSINEVLPRVSAVAQLVTLDHGPISTGDPWLAAGATTTTGNNVDAFLDSGTLLGVSGTSAATNGYQPGTGDVRVAPNASNTFDYSILADDDPSTTTAQYAAIVNLFYMNNWLHDWWYDHGFNEVAGNAQTSNYGRGGKEGDAISAQGQDASGRNNANMATPADGSSPTMQMYLFDGPLKGEVRVLQPYDSGALKFGGASFGPNTFDVTANVAIANDGQGDSTSDGCSGYSDPVTGLVTVPAVPDPNLAGKIALIDRGNCNFTSKAVFALASGARAMVVVNNGDGDPISMGNGDIPLNVGLSTDPLYQIASVMIRKDDGQRIKDALGGGQSVQMHVQRLPSIDYDGTLDELVIAHEFFHYVSNRLVGDGSGLGNQQGGGMGEGWSDFDSLLLAVRPDDLSVPGNAHWQGAYPTGFYVIPNYYFGIRREPYSRDFSKNALTFKHIQDGVPLPDTAPASFGQDGASNSEVHNTGEIWSNMLFECYTGMLDSQRHSFTDTRSRMKDYVIAGLKMTPVNPTILEARDGVLAAALANDYGDFAACARGFAKRGAGVDAVAPDRASKDNVGVTESYTALVSGLHLTKLAYVPGTGGDCDGDGVLDANEFGTLQLTLRNDGTFVPDAAQGATLSTTLAGITFDNGGRLSIPPTALGSSVTVSIGVRAAALQGPQTLSLKLTLDPVEATDPAVRDQAPETTQLYVNYNGGKTRSGDDMEDSRTSTMDWTTSGATADAQWSLGSVKTPLGSGQGWIAKDPATASDLQLVTPQFSVPAGKAFTLAFRHYYAFETPQFAGTPFERAQDGGVIEVQADGGAWQDVLDYGASFTTGGYNGTSGAIGRKAYVGTSPSAEDVLVDFGQRLAGHTARLRFRAVSDSSTAGDGWYVDDVKLTGLAAPVFSSITAQTQSCPAATTGGSSGGSTTGSTTGGTSGGTTGGSTGGTSGGTTGGTTGGTSGGSTTTSTAPGRGGAFGESALLGLAALAALRRRHRRH